MENIKSFDCTPNPAMNEMISNFSSGTSTFKDSADIRPQAFLRVLIYGQQVITRLPVCPGSNEVGDECDGELSK